MALQRTEHLPGLWEESNCLLERHNVRTNIVKELHMKKQLLKSTPYHNHANVGKKYFCRVT